MTPSFAVVGRSNKGKSSIVATLVEDDQILIAPTPRTTTKCHAFTLKANGLDLLRVIDTPGFEEAPAVLEWLQAIPVEAHQRAERIRQFLREFSSREDFPFEKELLRPIMSGAAILYVADASKPFRAHFEAELEILRWTGQPSMALINQIGTNDYRESWQAALGQYFNKVRVFNAHHSSFQDRLRLLDEMRVLHDKAEPAIQRAMSELKKQQAERLQRATQLISAFIATSLSFQLKKTMRSEQSADRLRQQLQDKYQAHLQEIEAQMRTSILQCFNYSYSVLKQEEHLQVDYELELFSEKTWEIFGLRRHQIIIAGTAAGALAGGGLDAMVGGASIFVGTGIGALLGGSSSLYLAFSKPSFAGISISQSQLKIGPNRNPNFGFILLDRCLAFLKAVVYRTHARRDHINPEKNSNRQGISSLLNHREIRQYSRIFKRLSRQPLSRSAKDELHRKLTQLIDNEI